jgi:hypothetical protein
MRIEHGTNLLQAERIGIEMGCEIQTIKGTGERQMRHKDIGKSSKYNTRRKDATRDLISFLRRVQYFLISRSDVSFN